jgi:hypothetical protein
MIFILDCEDRATHIQQLIASTWKFPNSRLIGIPGAHIIDTFSHLRRWDWKNIYEILGTGNLPCHPTSRVFGVALQSSKQASKVETKFPMDVARTIPTLACICKGALAN